MDYSNVNVAGIKSAITSLMNNLNYESLTNASETLAGDADWSSELAKAIFMEGLSNNLDFLTNFKVTLNDALYVCDTIADWQNVNNLLNTEVATAAYYEKMRNQYIDKTTGEITSSYYWTYNQRLTISAQTIKEYGAEKSKLETRLKSLLPFDAFAVG